MEEERSELCPRQSVGEVEEEDGGEEVRPSTAPRGAIPGMWITTSTTEYACTARLIGGDHSCDAAEMPVIPPHRWFFSAWCCSDCSHR